MREDLFRIIKDLSVVSECQLSLSVKILHRKAVVAAFLVWLAAGVGAGMLTADWLPAAGREVGEAGAGPRGTELDTGHWPPPARS